MRYEKITAAHEGCWFDCARGIYIGEAIIATAVDNGWDWKAAGYEEGDISPDSEHYCEAWDDAERFMGTLAPEGYWFGATENGDWGLWKVEEEEGEEA